MILVDGEVLGFVWEYLMIDINGKVF